MIQKRIIFKMFAILLTGACMVACSGSDDDKAGNVTPQPNQQGGKTVILTGSLSPKSSETTRSVDADGNTQWVVGEKIGVIYQKTGGAKDVAEATITLIRGAQNAEFTATLTDVADGTQTVDLIYPYSLATTEGYNKTKLLNQQKGTIEDISANWDLATGKGQMKVSGETATLPSLTLKNQLCICKFTLKNNDGKVDFKVSSFAIKDGTNSYTITPASATNELTVALLPASGAAFTFTGTSLYTKKYTYENGKPLSEVTTDDIGRAIATDGKAYTMKQPLEEGTPTYTLNVAPATLVANRFYESTLKMPVINPVAILAYVGEDTAEPGYTHGLAFALKTADHDTDENRISWKKADNNKKDNPNSYYTLKDALKAKESGKTLSSIEGRNDQENFPAFYAAINNTIPLDETSPIAALAPDKSTGWFLPSIFQWNQMVKGLANTPTVDLHSNDDPTLEPEPSFPSWRYYTPHKGSSFNSKLAAIGGDELKNGGYFSSSEAVQKDNDDNDSYRCNYNYNSSFGSVGAQFKHIGSRARAAFAF